MIGNLVKIILPRIFEFFNFTFRFYSSREFGIIIDEIIFASFSQIFEYSWQKEKN